MIFFCLRFSKSKGTSTAGISAMTMENQMPSFRKKQRQDQHRGHLKYQRAHKRDRSGSQTAAKNNNGILLQCMEE